MVIRYQVYTEQHPRAGHAIQPSTKYSTKELVEVYICVQCIILFHLYKPIFMLELIGYKLTTNCEHQKKLNVNFRILKLKS